MKTVARRRLLWSTCLGALLTIAVGALAPLCAQAADLLVSSRFTDSVLLYGW